MSLINLTPKEKAELLFGAVNAEIPLEANMTDTVEIANKKMIKDHISTKKICMIIIGEVLSVIPEYDINPQKEHWLEVKKEIELL